MLRIRSLFALSVALVLVPLFSESAEAGPRTAGSMALWSSVSHGRMTIVRSGRIVALMEVEADSPVVPGSVPLDNATEGRLSRYLLLDRCPPRATVTTTATVNTRKNIDERCQFLLARQRALQNTAMRNMRLSPRARNVIEEVTSGARTVSHDAKVKYHSDSRSDTLRFIRASEWQKGLTGRPTNLNQTSLEFQEAVRVGNRRMLHAAPAEEVEE